MFQSKKLKRRTLYGQLFAQYLVPMHRLYAMTFRPSLSCTVAFTGQTISHGASSHCMHATGCIDICGSSGICRLPSPPNAPASALPDRKSTRLNSSHLGISYAVFCLKKICYITHTWA